jgi:hypothetical protein
MARALLGVGFMQTSLLHSAVFVALASGCAGTGQLTLTSEATTPELVVISPGVQVIADLDEPIFYSNHYYWRNQGGSWYRSASHTRGWARVEIAPVEIRTIERPSAYIHYRGGTRARVSSERRVVAPSADARERRAVAPPAAPRDSNHGNDDRHDRNGRHDNDGRHDSDDRHDRDGRHDKDDRHDNDDKHRD